jgi:1-aminocyclopropane-1-carboxylate deaminase/D-cysteine desulfhydrase-like pyridoxal-dependent ACC family enzyme
MADTAAYFPEKLQEIGGWFRELTGLHTVQPANWQLHFPATAKSFGSVNATIREFIRELARTEGVLSDPIYSGKMLFTLRDFLHSPPPITPLSGRILAIHSGGGMGIFSRM